MTENTMKVWAHLAMQEARNKPPSWFTVREDIDVTKPIYDQVRPLPDEAAFTVSRAMKVLSALTRQGVEMVDVDGEAIDLWDVKRDLRGLLGPEAE